jgi:Na+-driven multidrug efflux pump
LPPATIKDAYRFFVPLMLTAELMMLSHAMVVAFLARMQDPAPILAAFSIAFYLHALVGSPVWACQIVALSFIRDRASLRTLLMFSFQAAGCVAWIWILIGATPAGDWFFITLFGASEAVARTAKYCTLLAFLMVPCVLVRSLAYGLMMVGRRTVLVTYGSIVRVVVLFVLLVTLTQQYEGAVVGITALLGCIVVETLYAVATARRFYLALPMQIGEPPTYRQLWKYSWPIMLMQIAESGVSFCVNFFLGRFVRPELALAAFGVLDSIVRVLLSPLRNIILTIQTLMHARTDVRILMRFSVQVGLLLSAVMLLFCVPAIRDWLLFSVMGLPAYIASPVASALQVSFALALCMSAACVARGLLIASHNTLAIAFSSGARVVAVFGVGILGVSIGATNGALLGLIALTAAFATEAVILTSYLIRLERRGQGLFRNS